VKKRLFVWLFICAMALGMMSNVMAAKTINLVMWTQQGDPVLGEIQRLCKEYTKKYPNIRVEVLNYSTEDIRTNFQTAAFAGAGPDLLWTVSDHAGPLSIMKIINPIDKVMPRDYEKRFTDFSLEAVELDGKVWGVPISVGNHLMLLYNKNIIKEAPKDTDEMIKVAKEVTIDKNGDGTPDQYGLLWNFDEPFWLAPWLGGFGGWPLDGRKPTLDTPAMVKTLQFMHDLKFKHKIVPMECNYDGADALFRQGKGAMMINGDWALFGYLDRRTRKTVDLGVDRIPKVSETGKWPSPMTSGQYFMFPSYLTDKERIKAVRGLVYHFESKEVQTYFLKEHKRLPSLKSMLKDPALTNDPIMSGSMRQLEVGRPMPTVPEMRPTWDAMRPEMQAVMAGKITPAQAAKNMQKAAEQGIREMNK